MNKTAQGKLAFVFTLIALFALTAVTYLVFIFPKTVSLWAGEGRALSAVEQVAVRLSEFCRSAALPLLPLLLVGVVGCATWAAIATHGRRQEAANKIPGGNQGQR